MQTDPYSATQRKTQKEISTSRISRGISTSSSSKTTLPTKSYSFSAAATPPVKATRSIKKGVKELLAASGKESEADGVGPMSFTRRLIYALDRMGSVPFTVSQLYSDILRSPLSVDFPDYAWTTDELRLWQRTPIYDPLSRSTKSITMACMEVSNKKGAAPGRGLRHSSNFSGRKNFSNSRELEELVPESAP
jgi:hypothetical protein